MDKTVFSKIKRSIYLYVCDYKKEKERKKLVPSKLYVYVSLVSLAIVFLAFQISKGSLISCYFWGDTRDTAMDFFHSIEYVRGRDPYRVFDVLYPPLANLFFLLMYNMVPRSVSEYWTMDFWQSLKLRGTQLDLRTYQSPMILYLVFVMVCVFLIAKLTEYAVRDKKESQKCLIAFSVLMSYGILFCVERGNIFMLSWITLLYYLLNYRSKNAIVRELAIISLAISAGLKLYPAIFGLLLLERKEYKLATRAVLYGVLSVLLPLLVFHGGIGSLRYWLSAIGAFEDRMISSLGIGMTNILIHIDQVIERVVGISFSFLPYRAITFAVIIAVLASAYFQKEHWKKVLYLTLAMCLWTSQGEYVFSFFLIPLLLMFREQDSLSRENILEFTAMTLMTVNLPLFHVPNVINLRNAMVQGLVLLMLAKILLELVLNVRSCFKAK